jgi:hypothetical protein
MRIPQDATIDETKFTRYLLVQDLGMTRVSICGGRDSS